jgi:hypothetical protein
MTDLLQFTIHFENPTVNFSAPCNSCAKILRCLSELIASFLMRGVVSKMRATISSRTSVFLLCILIFSQPHKEKSTGFRPGDSNRFTKLYLGKHRNLTHIHMNFLPHSDRRYPLPILLNRPVYSMFPSSSRHVLSWGANGS